ncbi:MAG: hypothetical protein ACYDCL_21370 [Myxococcales bacterium]
MRAPLASLVTALAACTAAKPIAPVPVARELTLAYTGDVWGELGPCG